MTHKPQPRRGIRRLLDPDTWSVEHAVFILGFAFITLSPIPFAAQTGLHVLVGLESLTGAPAMLLALVAVLTGAASAYAAAGVATLLPVAYVVFYSTGARVISNPLAGAEFTSQVLLIAGALLALPAGIAVLVRHPRGIATPLRMGLHSRQAAVALATATLALGIVAAGGLAAKQASATAAAAGGIGFEPDARLTVVMENGAFSPATLHVRAGDVTELTLENRDGTLHTFTYEVDGRAFEQAVLPGTTTTFLLRIDEPGEFPFRCAPHAVKRGDAYVGMVGAIVVA